MGFFDLKVKCSVCDNEVGLNRFQLSKNVWICPSCLNKVGGTKEFTKISKMSLEDLKELVNTNNSKMKEFNATKKFGNYFYLDESKKLWAIPVISLSGKMKNAQIYKYSDIIDFELLEDGNSVAKGGIGRAIAGGLLFGNIGAVIGGTTGRKKTKSTCSKLQIKITLNSLTNSVTYINFIETEFKKDSIVYKTAYNNAQEILSVLQLICDSNKKNCQNESSNFSVADELGKFKDLLDNGAITRQEYEIKKQELLK